MVDQAAHVLSRFGLGARPGQRANIEDDPQNWVSTQIASDPDDRLAFDGRPTTQEIAAQSIDLNTLRRQAANDSSLTEELAEATRALNTIYNDDVRARLSQSIATETPVLERLVHFWTNHFTVSATKNDVRPLVGAFEREAIRPNVKKSFFDMLLAVEQHPAMLLYLDNTQSTGPNSPAGLLRDMGLNENLAREILELHTISTAAGYTQADVEAFAKIITGWSVETNPLNAADLGTFQFEERLHEPGTQTVLGIAYADTGVEQGKNLLQDLAGHPSTATFVATKLIRHFVSGSPKTDDIERVASVFLETDGDLQAVHSAVFELTSAWEAPFTKFRQPEEFVIAIGRATGIPSQFDSLLPNLLSEMGQQVYGPPSPAGWPDVGSYWLSGQSILRRADVAFVTGRTLGGTESIALMRDLYGDLLSIETVDQLANTPSSTTGLSLALASPELIYR